MSHFKPESYTSVSPYLIVKDARASIDFLVQVFDACILRQHLDPQGRIMHAEVKLDDSVIMLADSAPDWPSVEAHVHIYVADVDVCYAKALQAGARSVQQPIQKEDEDKRGGIKDTGGTTWWIATRLES